MPKKKPSRMTRLKEAVKDDQHYRFIPSSRSGIYIYIYIYSPRDPIRICIEELGLQLVLQINHSHEHDRALTQIDRYTMSTFLFIQGRG